jgi:hypothetical protein
MRGLEKHPAWRLAADNNDPSLESKQDQRLKSTSEAKIRAERVHPRGT